MKFAKIIAVLLIIAIFAILILGYKSVTAKNSQHVPAIQTTTIQIKSNPARNVIFGVAATTNASALKYSISSEIDYFRTDIGNNRNQERLIQNVTSAGGHYVGILDYVTVGASPSPNGCFSGCNWTLGDWNASVENAVESYPEIHVWEIWNEPQFTEWQSGFLNGSVYNYYLMLKSAYKIIKAHNSSDIVLCLGGDNVYGSGGYPSYSDYVWAQQLWNYGAANYCDAISLHIYTSFTYLMTNNAYNSNQTLGNILNDTLSAYENMTGKPIWITEIGIPSNNGTGTPVYLNDSTQKQSLFLNQTYSLLLSKPYVKGIFWFNLVGYVHPPYEIDFGLLNATTLKPKPSFYDLVRFVTEYK